MKIRVKGLLVATAVVLMVRVPAGQSVAPPDETKGYAEVVAQSAFGNVTSQSYGGEFGYTVWRNVQMFVEGGAVGDVATTTISAGAQSIAGALTQLQSAAVTYSVKQPMRFLAAGVRCPIAVSGVKLRPYVLGGFGAARIENDARFSLGGVENPAALANYVTLGTDLSGTATKPLLSAGGGVQWPAWRRLVVDFQYRYGRIFLGGEGINVNRAGLGLGVSF